MQVSDQPLTLFVAAAGIATAAAIVILSGAAFARGMTPGLGLPFYAMATPVILMVTGSLLILRGSRIGRVLLAVELTASVLALVGLLASCMVHGGMPVDSCCYPLAAALLLCVPAGILLFSGELSRELAATRQALAHN